MTMRKIELMRYGVATLLSIVLVGFLLAGDSCAQVAKEAGNVAGDPVSPAVQTLSDEVARLGWIVYSARSEQGDWDICCCRPNGREVRNLTNTPETSEFSPQLSRDGRQMLYRRLPRTATLDNNRHGEQGELVLADGQGRHARALGKAGEYPWASWSPDGKQIACLSIKGVFIFDLASLKEVRRLPRKGFFQQLTWSPDGRWLVGVANSFGASWSVAKMDVATGEATAVHKVDCCTPDWFPDSRDIIFSWRPPGQKSNPGYGWTQLWRTDLNGKAPQLVYGEDGRHVYGGQVSPDGKYVLFTGNMQEDGDPGNAGAPMGLMRLSDGPIIAGASEALRALHTQSHEGPVLVLPAGWEPCWTASELFEDQPNKARDVEKPGDDAANQADAVSQLARELHDRGWIICSQKIDRGDWDLLRMCPDGTDRQKLTDTPEFNEAGARYSPDGKRILYYRMPISDKVDNNTYGTHELIVADADGTHAESWGRDYAWATWGPDGKQIACLTRKEVQVYDVATRQLVTSYPRSGIVSQLTWSPDGSAFLGTANGLGPYWNIGVFNCETRAIAAVSETDRYNCTSDWSHDGQCVLYARGIIPEQGGYAELWSARRDGTSRELLYAESSTHIYGACSSPDGRYLLFTRSVGDLGPVDDTQTTMSIVRRSDTPMHGGDTTPRLDLGPGWEPDWTARGGR